MGFFDDNEDIINCPACGKKMKKVFLQNANINVDVCLDGCGGIFFDNKELEKFNEKSKDADEIFALYKSANFSKTDTSAIRTCPVCDTKMVKMGSNGVVEIDICNVCGGTFLDYGELEKIRNGENITLEVWDELFPDVSGKKNVRRMFFETLVKRVL